MERVVAVRALDTQKHPWVVTPKLIDGVEFVPLCKRDGGFARFVSEGADEDCKFGDMMWLDTLKQLRMEAVLRLSKVAQEKTLFTSDAAVAQQKKKQRLECRTRAELGDLPNFVEVDLPPIQHKNVLISTCQVKVATELATSKASVQIEMSAIALQYVRMAMQASCHSSSKKSRCSEIKVNVPCSIYWRPERDAYIAKRMVDGVPKYSTFKVKDGEKDEAEAKARRYAEGFDD